MTTRDRARPPAPTSPRRDDLTRPGPKASRESDLGPNGIALPERLNAARERKGVDLYRAERDTKIRARYLAALERGDYRELPGAVYTKGFLRNYALYLGLDPDDVLEQWRAERGEATTPPATIEVPKPLMAPRRGLTFSPGVAVAAVLTLAVVAFVAYLGVQLLRFAKPPTIAVSVPSAAVIDVEDGTTAYTFEGSSIPGATVEISATGREQPYRVSADDDGSWTVEVQLSRGRNQFEISAKDPETGKAAEVPVQRVIMVPFPVIEAPTLTVDSPADGVTVENGAIPVNGRTTNAESVTVVATWLGPADGSPPSPSAAPSPSPSPIDPASPGPSPATPALPTWTVQPADDGTFSAPIELTTGRWSLTVSAASADGKTTSLTRAVTVSYEGITLVVSIEGGRAWLKVWVDGKVDESVGSSGRVFGDGRTLTFTGTESIEVRTGSSGVTFFTLNGQSLGALGGRGVPETWLFTPTGPPQQTSRS
jgi:cytoskeletal protein RodZ